MLLCYCSAKDAYCIVGNWMCYFWIIIRKSYLSLVTIVCVALTFTCELSIEWFMDGSIHILNTFSSIKNNDSMTYTLFTLLTCDNHSITYNLFTLITSNLTSCWWSCCMLFVCRLSCWYLCRNVIIKECNIQLLFIQTKVILIP